MISIALRHFSVVRRTVVRMSSTDSSYEDAIRKLNSLQSNKATIEQIKKSLKTGQKCTNIEDMENYLQRVGIPLLKLDELSVIHVAGTKGKGSTSAMSESILRHHGFRTGFYSSPHLVAARERIRLDGRPLSREQFAEQFHHVYGLLWDSQEFEGDMPKYFAFLTVLAFHVFLRQRVDVAVVEVGIGGIVDYTNVLRKVPVVGITALGLDHTSILGHTLPEIAAAKAGVMKRNCDAYTVRQPSNAFAVLSAYADYMKCPLTVVPDYTSYTFPETEKSTLPVDLDAYRINASLAIQLSHAWMRATQENHVHSSIVNYVNKYQNGSHSSITNGDNITLTNSERKGTITTHVNSNLIGTHFKITNDIRDSNNEYKIDVNNIFKNNVQNSTNKAQNGLTNGNGLNEMGDASNVLNKHAKVTNTQNDTYMKQNDYCNKIPYAIQNKDHKDLRNGDELSVYCKNTNGTYKVENYLQNKNLNGVRNKDRNGLIMDNLVYKVPYETAEGLMRCKWPGRYHVVDGSYAKFYLDGAHTKESMEICVQWFSNSSSSAEKTLIFSATGDRNAETLLQPLTSISFAQVYFVIPTAHKVSSTTHDNYSLVEQEELIQRCHNHARIWQQQKSSTKITVLECVADALVCIKCNEDKPSVLITGSLHLVGAALSILDPTLST